MNNVTESGYPILGYLDNNLLLDNIKDFIDFQTDIEKERIDIAESLKFFEKRSIQITALTSPVHDELVDSLNFVHLKSSLKYSLERTGLLLLPEVVLPDFTFLPDYIKISPFDYPIDGILYRWMDGIEYDKMSGIYDEEDPLSSEGDRELVILPIFQTGTTQASSFSQMHNHDDMYRWTYNEDGREWYGNVLDYVMSFLLFYDFEVEKTQLFQSVKKDEQRRSRKEHSPGLEGTRNDVEIIDFLY